MTVGLLKKCLANGEYPDDMHVCAALLSVQGKGKVEILDTWVDRHGVLNLITGPDADEIDPDLKRENDLL